jgi:hypothetical protein
MAAGLCVSPEGYFRIKIARDPAKRRNIGSSGLAVMKSGYFLGKSK